MSDDPTIPVSGAPAEGVPDLPREIDPPPELEDRVVAELDRRGLLAAGAAPRTTLRRNLLAVAASIALLVVGFLAGRATVPAPGEGSGAAAVAERRYALLLYETDGYRAASGAEEIARYHEYSRWVAEARARDQFVTGEDLAVARGWVIEPAGTEVRARPGVAPATGAPLSGIFLITARDDEHARDLAKSLPHLRHGGQVVIQEVVPTDEPPEAV